MSGEDPAESLLCQSEESLAQSFPLVGWRERFVFWNAWSTPLDPRIDPEQKAKGNFTNSRAIIDACRPFHWRDKFPKVNIPSPATARKAREKFGYLLG